jgi:hypothetical protein
MARARATAARATGSGWPVVASDTMSPAIIAKGRSTKRRRSSSARWTLAARVRFGLEVGQTSWYSGADGAPL